MFQQNYSEFERPIRGQDYGLTDGNDIVLVARRLSRIGNNAQVTFSSDFDEVSLPMGSNDKLLVHAYDVYDQDQTTIASCECEVRSGTLHVTNIEVSYAFRYGGLGELLTQEAKRISGLPMQEFGEKYFKYL